MAVCGKPPRKLAFPWRLRQASTKNREFSICPPQQKSKMSAREVCLAWAGCENFLLTWTAGVISLSLHLIVHSSLRIPNLPHISLTSLPNLPCSRLTSPNQLANLSFCASFSSRTAHGRHNLALHGRRLGQTPASTGGDRVRLRPPREVTGATLSSTSSASGGGSIPTMLIWREESASPRC